MTDLVLETEAGSRPLKVVKYEIYARERALCCAPESAAQRAGYPPRCGAHTRLERRQDVRDRIAWLAGDDSRLIREKRRRLEERLNLAAYGDIMEFAVVDPDTGKLTAIDWRKVQESPLAPTICEFGFDAKTGELVRFKRDDALGAVAQLRDMLGFKAPTKSEFSGPDGAPLQVTSITRTIVEPGHSDRENLSAPIGADAL